MEAENLTKFIDNIIEVAYQSRCFAKEHVQQILATGHKIKQKIAEAERLETENLEQKTKLEALENENKLLREKFNVSDSDLQNLKNENIINEIDVKDIEEVSNHTPKIKKLH